MEVDVDIHRCRVGPCVARRDTSVILRSFITSFSKLVKHIGSVTFIRTLLIMACIESNPGPDKFIFRYQYLLIEVGTQMMRKLFDHLTANDFMQYLNANPKQNTQLQKLINDRILTAEQTQVLPPIDNKPNTFNFDITLLACLLRNVCGLSDPKHSVWKTPAPGDPPLETDITMFRLCRNNLQHMTTVTVSVSEFQSKWNELVSILNRLSAVCGLKNLNSLIDEAEHKEIDNELKKQFDETLKELGEVDLIFDRGIEGLKLGQSDLIQGQSELKHGQTELKENLTELKQGLSDIKEDQSGLKENQSELKDGQSEIKENQAKIIKSQSDLKDVQREGKEVQCEIRDDLRRLDKRVANIEQELPSQRFTSVLSDSDVKECLKKSYLETCDKLQVSPLFNEDDAMDLLTIYQTPDMCHLPYHRDRETEGKYPISSYQDIFTKDGKSFRNIYVTGDAGVGKSSFCQRMALLWSKSQSGDIIDNEDVKRDIDFMRTFDFVFYVSLRDTRHTSIVKMIIDTFFYTDSEDIMKERLKLIENILCVRQCLIILDGFDEWTPIASGNETRRLPRKIKSETCTYVTSCRPYKIESVRLDKKDLDRQIQTTGLCEKSTVKYVEKIVDYVNAVNKDNKKPFDFLSEVEECALDDQICIPIIASQLVMLWFNKRLTDMSRAALYGNIIEMMLERAVEKKGTDSISETAVKIQLPKSFAELTHLQMHASLLEKVCSLSFQSLFLLDKGETGFVFTEKQLMSYSIISEEIITLCRLGILSKNKVIGSFARKELKITFVHKSYTEFFAALFVYSFDKNNSLDTIVNTWNSVKDIVQYKNFFIFLTGISYEKVQCLLEIIYCKISDKLAVNSVSFESNVYQNFVLSCYKEACRSQTANVVLKLEHFGFGFEDSLLLRLLELNRTCVKSIHIFESVFTYSRMNIDVIDIFKCIKDSQLEHLDIKGVLGRKIDYDTLACTIKTLPCIRSLTLYHMKFPDVFLQLHPDVTQVEIVLFTVTMSRQCFQCFIDNCVNSKSKIKVELSLCKITSFDGETRSERSCAESVTYMSKYLKSKSTINISYKDDRRLHFEKTSFK